MAQFQSHVNYRDHSEVSQWDSMLKLISKNLQSNDVNHLILNGSYHVLNSKIRKIFLNKST